MAAMDNLITVVNKLQGACTALGDNAASDKSLPGLWSLLPTIVVIGGQSSGKSSVLEAVVGRDFLPRGTGIVTRRPLILQLVRTPEGTPEHGEFVHAKGQRFDSFEAMSAEIEAETHRHLERCRKPVSPDPIQLTVYSPVVPNLTMVDMPGLTKIAIDGQPASIVKDLDDMARTYVKGENSIILAVSPANADLATSDALRMAREVDPSGDRTIGVLTKLDIMDPGTDARDIMTNAAVQLKHGWIAVVNRNQADLNGRVSMQDARRKELEFFRKHPAYKDLKNVGTNFLSGHLSDQLLSAIRRQMPTIQHHIHKNVSDLQRELDAMGGIVDTSRGGMVHTMLVQMRQFEMSYKKALEGGRPGGQNLVTCFDFRMVDNMAKLPFHRLLEPKYVRRVLEEADGYQPHLVAPEMGYRRLLEESIKLFHGPVTTAVEEVFMVLRSLVEQTFKTEECRGLVRYRSLRGEIGTAALKQLEKLKGEAKAFVEDMVIMETAYFSTNYFRELFRPGGAEDEEGAPRRIKTLDGGFVGDGVEGASAEDTYLRQIGQYVSGYLRMVQDKFKDTVPKAIVHKMVHASKERLLEDMHAWLMTADEPKLQRALMEDDGLMKKREQLQKRLSLMNRAAAELSAAHF